MNCIGSAEAKTVASDKLYSMAYESAKRFGLMKEQRFGLDGFKEVQKD